METIQGRLQEGKFSLIAEIGVNYYDIAKKLNISAMEAAKMMVLEAKNAGIHAVKFQTYKAGTLASKNSPSYWDTTEETTKSQYELFKKFDAFGEKEYTDLKVFCDQIGIEFCSTPFDFASADYLFDLMNFYKISSSDLSNLPFIKYIAQKNKPILLSIGASNLDEIQKAVDLIHKYNDKKLTLLHCVLEYPTPYEHANLAKISSLKKAFPDEFIGYSDHTKPDYSCNVIKTAFLLGAQVVEKHFTLDKKLPGNDHYHAMDVRDAEDILHQIEYVEMLKGNGDLVCLKSEGAARLNARRSVVAACEIKEGTTITVKQLTFKRPGSGISPADIEKVVGKKATRDIAEDTILQWDMIGDK
ncbi:N-acetylneuraminate synthase family protein [Acidaminococcus massiliensis]|uniref:N-acetylneuraminate synthase family protein n=1 Tax=Acidaminococcus massiliensis TaxID=1852375 RepID=UPI00248E4AA4|nr:N-acetylneuraminate synthase family protein [Acidaminococcus massiliensis]